MTTQIKTLNKGSSEMDENGADDDEGEDGSDSEYGVPAVIKMMMKMLMLMLML